MSLLTLATPLFVELAQQLASRSSRRNSGSQPAKAPGALSDLPNEGTTTPEPNLGTLLYLISLGVVATATAVVFLGLAFFLLTRTSEGLTVDPRARDRGVEIEPRRPDPVPSPGLDAALSTVQTPARSVFLEKRPGPPDVLPPATKDTASGLASAADTGEANATFDGSSSQEQPGLRSNADEATLATPTGLTHASAHHKMAPRTGSIANQLNHEELARLQTGSSMPPPAPMGGMPPLAPMPNPSGGNSLGFPDRAPGHFVDRR
jgi:hypothetical protein